MAAVTPNHDGRHHAPAPSHGPVPGSPTLTNPDMILPDYDPPDSPDGRSQSPLMAWVDPNVDQMDFQLPPQNEYGSKPMAPTTPIIYGNGTMLSDIGEVTEVESTVGPTSRRASSRYSGYTDMETYGPSSSSVMNKTLVRRSKIEQRERRSSIDSTSTITTQDQRAAFADFDDAVSVDDSNFQGDDEESMASSYVEGTAPQAVHVHTMAPVQDEVDDRYSTAYISNRAEQILANAKRRLTAMEGNLSRARSSIGYSDGSTPSPQLGIPAGVARDGTTAPMSNHSRIKSEDGIRDLAKQPSLGLKRSASALGSAGGYRPPTSKSSPDESTTAPSTPSRPSHGISHHPLDLTLEPLSEDEVHDSWSATDSVRNSSQSSSLLSPTFGAYFEKGLTRSASAAQMRGIQDQMQGLRGKISTLKEQARADSLKRRSLQSLRTPSPFTHARWDQGHMEPSEIRNVSSGEETPTNTQDDDEPPQREVPADEGVHIEDDVSAMQDERKTFGAGSQPYSGSSGSRATPTQEHQHPRDNPPALPVEANAEEDERADSSDDMRTENGDVEGDAGEEENDYGSEVYDDAYDDAPAEISDWGSESGESLYHETQQYSTSHEDREDAFDYEHFFLHSAMGNMSRRADRASSESEFSDDSVETTRGPTSSRTLRKRYSGETNASDDTFATANEGRASRSSAFGRDLGNGGAYDGSYEELPPLQEVGSNDSQEVSPDEPPEVQSEVRPGVQHDVQIARRHRPMSAAHADRLHRPSISSFESTGTNRSFPLVNKSKINGGVLTPGSSPDPVVRQMSEALVNGKGSTSDGSSESNGILPRGPSKTTMQNLAKEDQIAVERLVASLGNCILGLGESSRAGSESRVLRRRIDAARQILEGQGEV